MFDSVQDGIFGQGLQDYLGDQITGGLFLNAPDNPVGIVMTLQLQPQIGLQMGELLADGNHQLAAAEADAH
ncbi:hypothetical protein D3C75_1032150 [compost metagenome]